MDDSSDEESLLAKYEKKTKQGSKGKRQLSLNCEHRRALTSVSTIPQSQRVYRKVLAGSGKPIVKKETQQSDESDSEDDLPLQSRFKPKSEPGVFSSLSLRYLGRFSQVVQGLNASQHKCMPISTSYVLL